MASFTELEVWKQARKIRNWIAELTKSFPADEKYRLADQVIRSSSSIGNNIAEGHGRYHYQDNIRFLCFGTRFVIRNAGSFYNSC